MGTNFYMSTNNKDVRDKYFGYDYEIVDTPDWGYEIHIAKTSGGWLPLFQSHDCFNSIKGLKELYNTGHFVIYDEYNQVYDWPAFEERVIKWNGGVDGAIPKTYHKVNKDDMFYDPDMPGYTPVSHFTYGNGKYAYLYFKDSDGFEFCGHDFS